MVRVRGHETLSTRQIVQTVVPDRDAPFDAETVAAGIDSLIWELSLAGRPYARIEAGWREVDGRVELDLTIDEGPEARLAGLEFEGVRAVDPASLVPLMDLGLGSPITKGAVEEGVQAVLAHYERLGRPFASVRVTGARLAPDGGLVLTISVDEGMEARLAEVLVSGNDVTKDRVIVRESGLRVGEPLDLGAVSRVRSRLERLGLFDVVSEPVVAVDPANGAAAVGIEVSEGPANRISGALGYAPGAGGADGELTGRVYVALGNIAGTGRAAAVEWERVGEARTRIGFSYEEPWLLGAPIDVAVRGAQVVHDTVYTTTEADISVTARMGDRTRVTWSIGGERYVPGAADESTTTSYRTSLGAEFDGTDVPDNPRRGASVAGSIQYAAKREHSTDDRDRSGTFAVEAWLYLPVRSSQVVALGARGAGIASTEEDVPFHELLTLGGAGSLRGYREEQFRGTRTGLLSVEYRFILSRRARALAFVDVGYYYRGGSNFAKDTKLGYGIGLRGVTRLGIISLDYGLGEGDGLLDGKLHVGLIREF